MKDLFRKEVPLWLAVLCVGVILLGAGVAFAKFRQVIYSNSFNLSSGDGSIPYTYGSWPALADDNFYRKVLGEMVAQKATFINADLTSMKLHYYVNGTETLVVPILAKGRPGSWWETPVGLYKVQAKNPSDFSHFAHVYSPWALAFQGNFLIHGWPYYPDGTPVGSTYSGGCIRLSTADAKTLYDMVSAGTPVLVSSDDFTADSFHEQQQSPGVNAESYLAADLKSNYVFAEKNPDEQLPIASLTKLVTALVAVEYVDIEKTITVTPDMIVPTSIPRLKVGETYSLYDLLQPLLKESSNEAAVAISNFLGPKYFVSLMNQQAAAIGMKSTRFADASGADWNDVSTAHDLYVLSQYLYNNRSFILKMTTNRRDTSVYGPSAFDVLQNLNVFADDPSFVGGKVGVNGAASDTIVSIFKEPFLMTAPSVTSSTATWAVASDTTPAATTVQRPVMLVILGSTDYANDAKALLSWVKQIYQ